MKKLHLIILGVLLSLTAAAQNICDAFYIYRNDGQFNAFFRDEIDSITYSCYDLDSTYREDYVTQVVHTSDSIYRIPLEVIDSVGFVTPETVYQPGVVLLEGKIRNYILSSDSLSIFFSSETPASFLPHVGDKLVTDKTDAVFPSGFVGQVENVQTQDGKFVVSCSLIDLTDVYQCYYYTTSQAINDIRYIRRRANSDMPVIENTYERTFSPGTQTFVITDYITPHIDTRVEDLAFHFENYQSLSFTPTFHVKYSIVITPERGEYRILDITEEDVIAEDFSATGALHYAKDVLHKTIPIIDLGIPYLWLYFDAGVFVNADATLSTQNHFEQQYRYNLHVETVPNRLLPHASISGVRLSNTHSGRSMINGELSVGLFAELGVSFISKRLASVAYRGEVGVTLGSDIVITRDEAETALHSTDLYNHLNGHDLYVNGFWRTGLPVKLLVFNWPNNLLGDKWDFIRVSLVPNFANTKLKRDHDDGDLYAQTKVSLPQTIIGSWTPPVDLGFTLFEKDILENGHTTYSFDGYTGQSTEMYATYSGKPTSKTYEVYPTVKLMGIEMLAEPSADEDNGLCPDDNHPHMIDLGLPSGTLWACCNVGAHTPEEYGGYYAWGETQTKSYYDSSTYSYWHDSDGDNYVDTNELTNIGSDIAGTFYDAATANWGAPWRMPSLAQVQELLNKCSSRWAQQNGVNGRLFTGSNGGTIFLPAAGNRWGTELDYEGSLGLYWSSSLVGSYPYGAYDLNFGSGGADWGSDIRDNGFTVRPVRKN